MGDKLKQIQKVYHEFIAATALTTKAGAATARVLSGGLRKLLKEFRELSIANEKGEVK